MDASWYVIGAGLVLAAGASFFFALAESALLALGKFRAQQMVEDKPEEGRRIAPLYAQPEDLVAALTFGNTLANATIIGLTVWVLTQTRVPAVWGGLACLVVILIGCEVIPKALGVRAPEFWSVRVGGAMSKIVVLTRPFRRIAQAVNEGLLKRLIPKSIVPQPLISGDEYQDLLNIAQQQGALALAEKEIILKILNLDTRTAGDVMRVRSQIACISDELSREEMLAEARRLRHTRIPIYDENPDTIVGILNVRSLLLNPEADLEEVMEFPSFVPQSMNLLQLLRSLQRQHRGVAIVLDEFGGTAGLVTMEDILEETLGRFQKKSGAAVAVAVTRLAPGRWRVSGDCSIEEFRRELPALPVEREADTMNGLFVNRLEYVPGAGESFLLGGVKFTARRVDSRRVLEMEVELVSK